MANFRQELTKKLLINFLIIGILGIGLIFLGWNLDKQTQKIKKQHQDLADRSAEISLLVQLQNQSSQADVDLGILENVLPSQDQLFDFPKELESLAKQMGIGFGFNWFSNQETVASLSRSGRLGFALAVQGSWPKILGFIKSLEASRFLINFQSFDFSNSGADIKAEVLFH